MEVFLSEKHVLGCGGGEVAQRGKLVVFYGLGGSDHLISANNLICFNFCGHNGLIIIWAERDTLTLHFLDTPIEYPLGPLPQSLDLELAHPDIPLFLTHALIPLDQVLDVRNVVLLGVDDKRGLP